MPSSELWQPQVWLPTLVGVVFSIGFFLLTYWKTIGVRRERARSANREMVELLLKRIVNEGYSPTFEDLSHLISATAQKKRVRATRLGSPAQLLNRVFVQVLESDLIQDQQRSEILEKVRPTLLEAEDLEAEELQVTQAMGEVARQFRPVLRRVLQVVAVATFPLLLTAAAVGLLVGYISEGRPAMAWPVSLAVLALSVVVVAFLVFSKWLRDDRTDSEGETPVTSAAAFQGEVARLLRSEKDILTLMAPAGSPFDFLAEGGGKKILIEAKNWSPRVRQQTVRRAVVGLSAAVERHGGQEGILVTPSEIKLKPEVTQDSSVRILPFNELCAHLRSHS